jgi:UDPglucose--hexose-1-phosphate uridylyltransferase
MNYPHRRFNPLTGEWVLVSPHRTKRPWQGQEERAVHDGIASYDPACYLCPGNERANKQRNPHYTSTYVFTNDFAALFPDIPKQGNDDDLFKMETVKGTCRVLCFSPRHDITLPEMELSGIVDVVEMWIEQFIDLGSTYRWVQLFENKGEIMGCSNPHPHGQIWAVDELPNEAVKENRRQKEYFLKHRSSLLSDYRDRELEHKERVIAEDECWVVVVPYWAVWPFETLLLPRRDVRRLSDLNEAEIRSLAVILKRHLSKYDNLFNVSFPYTMGWHNAPCDDEDYRYWIVHAHFYPPLLRSATIKKFMVGYEMLSESQRDITPEHAAEVLRNASDIHFRSGAR